MEYCEYSSCDYADSRNWYAVYTVVRHEKSVNRTLVGKEIETFLPLRTVVSKWKDRKKKVEFPLFPGYLFINTSLSERLKVLNTRGVIRILGVNGEPVPVSVEQIETIRALTESSLCCDPYPYISEGKEVYVTSGPLEGMKGKIVERRGEHRLILSVDLIKRSVSVEVDITDIELN